MWGADSLYMYTLYKLVCSRMQLYMLCILRRDQAGALSLTMNSARANSGTAPRGRSAGEKKGEAEASPMCGYTAAPFELNAFHNFFKSLGSAAFTFASALASLILASSAFTLTSDVKTASSSSFAIRN